MRRIDACQCVPKRLSDQSHAAPCVRQYAPGDSSYEFRSRLLLVPYLRHSARLDSDQSKSGRVLRRKNSAFLKASLDDLLPSIAAIFGVHEIIIFLLAGCAVVTGR